MIRVVSIDELKKEITDKDSLIVIEAPERHGAPFIPCWNITLAEQLVSLFPIKISERFSGGEPLFSAVAPKNLLMFALSQKAEVLERCLKWLGLQTRSEYFEAWSTFVSNYSTDARDELSNARLACHRDDVWYYPLPVWIAVNSSFSKLNESNVYHVVGRFRRYAAENSYVTNKIIDYLRRKSLDMDPAAKSFGPLTDPDALEPGPRTVDCLLGHLDQLRRTKPDWFEHFAGEQLETWRNFTKTKERLRRIAEKVAFTNLHLRKNDYIISNKALRTQLELLADAYAVVSEFENFWGIDKLTAPQLLNNDVFYLKKQLQSIKMELHDKLKDFRDYYQSQWGIWRVSDVVKLMLLGEAQNNNLMLPYGGLPREQNKVLVFILDGYGMVQHLWSKRCLNKLSHRSFFQDVFEWFRGRKEFNESILGSTLSADTGSGLAALLTGRNSRENGILASKMWNTSTFSLIDVLKEGVESIVGSSICSFLNTLPDNIQIKVLHGGAIGNRPNSFASFLYGTRANYSGLNLPERIFTVLRKSFGDVSEKELFIAYYPLIDRMGHSVGSFSRYEQNEIQRFKSGLLAFLIDLVYEREDLFDGNTTLLFTADHGMFETSGKYITVAQVKECLDIDDNFIWSNRSIWVYSQNPDVAAEKLVTLLRNMEIQHEIYFKFDETIKIHYGGPNIPDLIVIFTDEGLVAPNAAARAELLLFGAHGGRSNEEAFVPLISLCLTPEIFNDIRKNYRSLEG